MAFKTELYFEKYKNSERKIENMWIKILLMKLYFVYINLTWIKFLF